MTEASKSLALLPVNEFPPPRTLEQELAAALDDAPAGHVIATAKRSRKAARKAKGGANAQP